MLAGALLTWMAERKARVFLVATTLLAEMRRTRPLSKLMGGRIEALRRWAAERTVTAD